MIVRGTKKIRGAVTVGLKYQLEANKVYNLTDDEYNKPEVQIAINNGFLKVANSSTTKTVIKDEEDTENENINEDKIIICKNTHSREISFKQFDFPIKPGLNFRLKESELSDPAIQSAISKKIITIAGSTTSENNKDIDDLNIVDVDVSEQINDYIKDEKIKEKIEPEDKISKFSSLRPIENEPEQNKEVNISKVIDDPDPEPVKKSDIVDPKGKSIAWDPVGEGPSTNTMKQGHVWDSKKQELKGVDDLEDGTGGPAKNSDDISFVDHEQEGERIQNNPQLKNTKKEFDDIIFVDEEQKEEKIKEFEEHQNEKQNTVSQESTTKNEVKIKRKRGRPKGTKKKTTQKTGKDTKELKL